MPKEMPASAPIEPKISVRRQAHGQLNTVYFW